LDECQEFEFSLVERATAAKKIENPLLSTMPCEGFLCQCPPEGEKERELICETQHQKCMLLTNQSACTINFDNGQFLLWQRRSQTVSCETKDICQNHSNQKAQM
jgi:hypothetical protein